MSILSCMKCRKNNSSVRRPKTGEAVCKECFCVSFENEIYEFITKESLFKRGDKIAIAASGGKDSTVLIHVLKKLNDDHDMGLDLCLLSIDEGITGYRDDSLATVMDNKETYGLDLKVLSYKELYGRTMDEIVQTVGKKNNCTFCGVFRRQALDRGAMLIGATCIATGHNADDIAETVVLNIIRGDAARFERCTSAVTYDCGSTFPYRCKPLKFTYEKEIVMYAHFNKLKYFSTECIYSPNAYRGHVRAFIKDLETLYPQSIVNIINSAEAFSVKSDVKLPVRGYCARCGYVSSMSLCKACNLLEGLNIGIPLLGIGKTEKLRRKNNLSPLNFFNKIMTDHEKSMSNISMPQEIAESSNAGCNATEDDS